MTNRWKALEPNSLVDIKQLEELISKEMPPCDGSHNVVSASYIAHEKSLILFDTVLGKCNCNIYHIRPLNEEEHNKVKELWQYKNII